MGMILSLRQAIMKRIQDKTPEELTQVIEDSIGGDDRALPGLGVILETIWQHSNEATREELVHTLKEHIHEQPAAESPAN